MEKQHRLIHNGQEKYPSEAFNGLEPDIKVTRNNYVSAGGMVHEVIIRKTWIIPFKSL